MPSIPGIRMSLTTIPGKSAPSAFSAASAPSKVSASKSESASHWATEVRMSASSSMIATLVCMSVMGSLRSLCADIAPWQHQFENGTALGRIARHKAPAHLVGETG